MSETAPHGGIIGVATKRRQSKRIKDLGDISRLVESDPELWVELPTEL